MTLQDLSYLNVFSQCFRSAGKHIDTPRQSMIAGPYAIPDIRQSKLRAMNRTPAVACLQHKKEGGGPPAVSRASGAFAICASF